MLKSTPSLRELVGRAGDRPTATGIPGLTMIKGNVPAHQLAALYQPMIGFTLQGTKTMAIGEQVTVLRAPCYFVLPVHVPATATVAPGRGGAPYMSLGLEIDRDIVLRLLRDLPPEQVARSTGDFAPCPLDHELEQALHRLLSLMTVPRDIPALAPAYQREIFYRVLAGPHGWYLRQLVAREGEVARMADAVKWLRDHYTQSFEIGELAQRACMATNTFHRTFKRVTGLSPIQFQKQLRLLEARSLIAFEGMAVSGAAYQVGYQSASQFNREYARFFGSPPARDGARLRQLEAKRAS